MMLKVRVVSFNVLSSHLASTTQFPTLNPDHLDANNRLRVVLDKLQIEVNNAVTASTSTSTTCSSTNAAVSSSDTINESTTTTDVSQPTIFALQEVSYDWAGAFHTFFANHGYHFVTGLYGAKFNGYMGKYRRRKKTMHKMYENVAKACSSTNYVVFRFNINMAGIGIAYPQTSFTCIETKISRLSDTRVGGWPRAPPPATIDLSTRVTRTIRQLRKQVVSWSSRLLSLPLLLTSSSTSNNNNDYVCPWDKAEKRFNVMLGIKLQHRSSGVTFCIGNYHMPCMFYLPPTMTIHADMAVRFIQDMATTTESTVLKPEAQTETELDTESSITTSKRIPYILAGDFNFKPIDGVYKYLTTGKFINDDSNNNDPFNPSLVQSRIDPNFKWTSGIVEPVKSSYATIDDGTEPDFTNYALTKDHEEPFIDTLDYIFISPNNIKVSDVLQIPNRIDANGPFPNLDLQQPSDHIMIAANLEITN
jgi:mRNA deadenylase 3'-5' endonuclease subunit Ccr4